MAPGLYHGLAGPGWCDLHCHSGYSMLDGAARPEALARRAAELDYPALALTDHNSLAGLIAHAHACAAVGVRPIAGCEITLDDGSHLTLLARDAAGYRSLARLVSAAHLSGADGVPQASMEDLAACVDGLECLTGCRRGQVSAALLAGDEERARLALDRLRALFGAGHVWVELQHAGLADDRRLWHGLAQLARQDGLGLVATGNAHYPLPGDRDLQDVLVCIRTRLPLARARPYLRPGASWHLRSAAEMAGYLGDLFPPALRGVRALVERCHFALEHIDAALPRFPLPTGQTGALAYLRALVARGAQERYGESASSAAVQARLGHELEVIAHLDLADYILIVWDIVRFAREQGILCQGRGSAVGSAVCFSLGITAVDPLAHHLSFARFLAPGRRDPPDIDLDLAADRLGEGPAREAVIQYVLTRYAGHAALVAITSTFQARSAIRDVGMALGLAPEQIDALARDGVARLSALADAAPAHGAEPGSMPPDALAGRLALPTGPVARRLENLCRRLEGLPRHLSQHPGGMVLTARPLAEVAPVQRPRMEDRLIVQWDRDAVEAAGLVKVDLLGLGILAVLDECFALLGHRTGRRPELHGFRCDDPVVYAALCAGDSVGVFQLESRAQISFCLPWLQPRCYEDLVAAVALIRPGPIQANATHPYLRRRRGLEPVRYPGGAVGRRLLEPILGDTLGVCLYQDQVIEVARACGLDEGEAAELRRAMSHARSTERMAALSARLEAGLTRHGLDAAGRAEVLAMIQAFARYGFVRGHAAAFAYLAYVSAWLKVYHPAIFCTALLNGQPMGFYPAETVMQDAMRHGVCALPIDVRASRAACTLEAGSVRLGLRLIQGLGAETCARLQDAVASLPHAHTLEALCLRARLTEDEATALARAGALRGYIPDRRQALWRAPLIARAARARWLPGTAAALDQPAPLPRATPAEEMALDRAALGLSTRGHLLAPLRAELRRRSFRRIADLSAAPASLVVEVAS